MQQNNVSQKSVVISKIPTAAATMTIAVNLTAVPTAIATETIVAKTPISTVTTIIMATTRARTSITEI